MTGFGTVDGWDGWLSVAVSVLTAIVLLSSIAAVFLRDSKTMRRAVLSGAIRHPLRRPRAWGIGDPGVVFAPDDAGRWRRSRARRRLVAELLEPLDRLLDGKDVQPADVVAYLEASDRVQHRGSLFDAARALAPVMRAASTHRATGLLARALYPSESEQLRIFFGRIADHLQRFATTRPVVLSYTSLPGSGIPGRRPTFRDFACALTGAPVLLDASLTRSGFVDGVLIWHRRSYRGAAVEAPDRRRSRVRADGYELAHPEGRSCALGAGPSRPDRKVGDFDRRVLSVRLAALAESPTDGRVDFVLETSETCYLATEQGDALADPDEISAQQGIGCKHLRPSALLGGAAVFERAGDGRAVVRVQDPDAGRVVLVASYVSLLTTDGELVLTRRSRNVRHGSAVISATAGGIVEPDGDGPSGDVDDLGMPSALVSVRREAVEEIGLDLASVPVRPVCVFLANVRNKEGSRRGRGQLVATVLFLARVPYSRERLRELARESDPALGGFEVDDLVFVDAPVATNGNSNAFADHVARFARTFATELDQHGVLSCLYAASAVASPEAARSAFESAFSTAPWWALTDVAESDPGYPFTVPRVVRDPRTLLVDDGAESDQTLASVVPAWRDSWAALPDRLDAAHDAVVVD